MTLLQSHSELGLFFTNTQGGEFCMFFFEVLESPAVFELVQPAAYWYHVYIVSFVKSVGLVMHVSRQVLL